VNFISIPPQIASTLTVRQPLFQECESDEAAFAKLLAPVVKVMGAKVTNGLLDILTKLVTVSGNGQTPRGLSCLCKSHLSALALSSFTQDQRQLLTLGHYNASAPTPASDTGYSKLNGIGTTADTQKLDSEPF
jgi:hypothetical protein